MKHQRELRIASWILALGVSAPAFAADVAIKSWPLPPTTSPTGHYPHDAMVAEDGSIWYAALNSNSLGRFDPRTETIEEVFADIPDSGPHGLKQDDDGNIWFTAIKAEPTYIGMMNQKTGEFTEHPVTLDVFSPNVPRPRSAHSLSLDDRGYVWYTDFARGYLGRFDTKSETWSEWPTPGGSGRDPMGWWQWELTSGTTNRGRTPADWFVSTPRRRSSRAG